jgi:hypothetical protein
MYFHHMRPNLAVVWRSWLTFRLRQDPADELDTKAHVLSTSVTLHLSGEKKHVDTVNPPLAYPGWGNVWK